MTPWRIKVADEFSATSEFKRSWSSLKNSYNMAKQSVKKKVATDKIHKKKTGGGPCESQQFSSTDEQMLEILGDTINPLSNPFDSDALYNGDT